MANRLSDWLVWSPRVLGIAVSLFLGVFALDAFAPGQSFLQGVLAFAIHLIPSFLLLATVALAWRWEWVGGVVFSTLGLWYARWSIPRNHLDWALLISGPLLLVGALFFVSWWQRHPATTLHA